MYQKMYYYDIEHILSSRNGGSILTGIGAARFWRPRWVQPQEEHDLVKVVMDALNFFVRIGFGPPRLRFLNVGKDRALDSSRIGRFTCRFSHRVDVLVKKRVKVLWECTVPPIVSTR